MRQMAVLFEANISVTKTIQNNPLHANATAAVPSHFNHPGHSITDIELIPFELQPTLSMSRGKARESLLHKWSRGKIVHKMV